MRLKNRNGLTRAEALRRIRSQMPLAMKRLRADYILDGTKNRESLSRDISRLFEDLRSL
jgi:dephospho-CoA kinase